MGFRKKKLDNLVAFNTEGSSMWKPMLMQPINRSHTFVIVNGNGRWKGYASIEGSMTNIVADIFLVGLCLPPDNKMAAKQQDVIIVIIHRWFQ